MLSVIPINELKDKSKNESLAHTNDAFVQIIELVSLCARHPEHLDRLEHDTIGESENKFIDLLENSFPDFIGNMLTVDKLVYLLNDYCFIPNNLLSSRDLYVFKKSF